MGEVRELAPFYLGAATVMSLGVGVVSLSVAGWRRCTAKLESATEKTATLEQTVQEQAHLIERLKFSDHSLAVAGLNEAWVDEATADAVLAQAEAGQHLPVASLQAEHNTPMDSVPPIPQGKTAFGAVVSNVFRQPLGYSNESPVVESAIQVDANDKATHPSTPSDSETLMSAVRGGNKLAIQTSEEPKQAQLQDLMEQMQKMMVQVKQLQAS
ncbi:MAG: hypothetical protein F6K30_21390 [Cyanothece sp. SIO2G6]|nr:hypothetical protein [Cyanothece sp. SIO2G6]